MATEPDFPVFDADNHLYETEDALTRHLPAAHTDLFRFVEIKGRKKLVVRDTDHRVHPEPDLRGGRPARRPHGLLRRRQRRGEDAARAHRRADARASRPSASPGPASSCSTSRASTPRSCSRRSPASSRSASSTTPTLTQVAIHAFNEWLHDEWTLRLRGPHLRHARRQPVHPRRGHRRARAAHRPGRQGRAAAPRAGERPARHPVAVPARVRPVLGPGPGGRRCSSPCTPPTAATRTTSTPGRAATGEYVAFRPKTFAAVADGGRAIQDALASADLPRHAHPLPRREAASASRTAAAGSATSCATSSSPTRRCPTSSPSTRARCSSATSGSTRSGRTRSPA